MVILSKIPAFGTWGVDFFDVCGDSTTFGPTPGRPSTIANCQTTQTTPAVRIEDERPGPLYFRTCQDLGTVITYFKFLDKDGLEIRYTTTSGPSRSLTVLLECDPGAVPVQAEGGHHLVPDRVGEVFSGGDVTLTWKTNAICATSSLGWMITFSILGAAAVFFCGGWAYGRFLSGRNPPKPEYARLGTSVNF